MKKKKIKKKKEICSKSITYAYKERKYAKNMLVLSVKYAKYALTKGLIFLRKTLSVKLSFNNLLLTQHIDKYAILYKFALCLCVS